MKQPSISTACTTSTEMILRLKKTISLTLQYPIKIVKEDK